MGNSIDRKDNMYSHLMKRGTELMVHTETKEKGTLQTENSERWNSMKRYLQRCACALSVSR